MSQDINMEFNASAFIYTGHSHINIFNSYFQCHYFQWPLKFGFLLDRTLDPYLGGLLRGSFFLFFFFLLLWGGRGVGGGKTTPSKTR